MDGFDPMTFAYVRGVVVYQTEAFFIWCTLNDIPVELILTTIPYPPPEEHLEWAASHYVYDYNGDKFNYVKFGILDVMPY